MVEVWLPYGRTEVCARVPTKNLLDIIEPNEKIAAKNPQAEIENALASPLGTKRLADSAKPGDKVSIVLRDFDTSTNHMMASAILKELNSAGIEDADVTVIVAYDPLHRSSTKEERPILGESLTARIRVVRHDCRTGDQMHIGKTSKGTEVYLNKLFAEADVKVISGVVEPHLYAGYSGGREGVLPGVSAIETIHQNMALALDRKAERGVLEGNPVHEDMVEAAQLADVDFALNAVLNGNCEIAEAFAGDLNEAFDESVKLVDKVCRVPVGGRADLVFISPGGSPFDGSLFEACKCLDAASEVTKRGKIIVLMAECVDGYGNREFYEAASRFKDSKALGKSLKKRFSVGGFMAYRLRKTLQSARMVLVSVLPDYYVSESLGMKAARTANDAYRYASDTVGRNGKVSFIPYGNLTMPTVKPAD